MPPDGDLGDLARHRRHVGGHVRGAYLRARDLSRARVREGGARLRGRPGEG